MKNQMGENMGWDKKSRDYYFDDGYFGTSECMYINFELKQDLYIKKNTIDLYELKKLIIKLTELIPQANHSFPVYSIRFQPLLLIGQVDMKGAIIKRNGRRVGLLWGAPLQNNQDKQNTRNNLYLFVDSIPGETVIESWLPMTDFFCPADIGGLNCLVYKHPISSKEIDSNSNQYLVNYLKSINEEYTNHPDKTMDVIVKFNNLIASNQRPENEKLPDEINILSPQVLRKYKNLKYRR